MTAREVKKEDIDDNFENDGANVFGGVQEDFAEENLMVAPEIYEEVSLCDKRKALFYGLKLLGILVWTYEISDIVRQCRKIS